MKVNFKKYQFEKNPRFIKVVFEREFPQKMWQNVFSEIFFKIQFFCEMAKCTTLHED